MRILLQALLVLAVVGLAGGWVLRSRLRTGGRRWVVAAAFLPFVAHAAYVAVWALRVGVEAAWVAAFAAACALIVVGAWWWVRRTARARPFRAPWALPAAAILQVVATQLLAAGARGLGVVVNPLPGVALFAVSVGLAATLIVVLPPRDPRPLGERGPRWWRALGRLGRRG